MFDKFIDDLKMRILCYNNREVKALEFAKKYKKPMIANKELIKNIAMNVNAHPIHIKVFMSNFENVLIDDVEDGFKKYKDTNPRPFVKWVGNFINLSNY